MGWLKDRVLSIVKYITYKVLYKQRLSLKSVFNVGPGFEIRFEKKSSKILIGKDFTAMKNVSIVSLGGDIYIGNGIYLNKNTSIVAAKGIRIGDNCLFGESVLIYDHNHNFDNKEQLIKEQGLQKEEIVIGDDVWIGNNVCILKGVVIGRGSVIGAHSVVTKDIPEFSVALGFPSRVVRRRGEVDEKEEEKIYYENME